MPLDPQATTNSLRGMGWTCPPEFKRPPSAAKLRAWGRVRTEWLASAEISTTGRPLEGSRHVTPRLLELERIAQETK